MLFCERASFVKPSRCSWRTWGRATRKCEVREAVLQILKVAETVGWYPSLVGFLALLHPCRY